MPLVATKKLLVRGHSDVVSYIAPWEAPLAKRRWNGGIYGKGKHVKSPDGSGCSVTDTSPRDPVALRTKEVVSVDTEYKACMRKYGDDVVSKFYVDKDEFRKAVEKAVLAYNSAKDKPVEIKLKAKKMGLTDAQTDALVARKIYTVEELKALDMVSLAAALNVQPTEAQQLRQKWWGEAEDEETIPVVLSEDE